MKREILLSDSCRAPQLWGYAGEKDHSVLIVELSKDIADCDFCQAEITIKGNLYRTDDLEIIDSKVRFELTTAMVEESGIITAQIVGYVIDENGNILEIAKSEIYTGNIKKSSSGKLTPADSDPSLLDRILAKLHVLIEKAHNHFNKSILDRFGEDEHGGLLYAGEEISSGSIQSLTAFPEVASEGDVVLLHRCNEISADDSNSGIILDPAAIASLKLPEGITNRRWEFVNTTPNGADFELILEQVRIDEDVPYVLTSIYLFSETYADRWYWKDGEPYTEIPETSTKPVPGYIPLGAITDFTATKSPMRGDEVWDVEDTDATVIFRTAPREYIYTNGGWKLTERTDAAEGSIIAEVKPVVRNGQNFLELRLTDSRGFKMGQRKKYIYIPVEGVKETGGINQQSVELIFPTAGTGGIKSVSSLPTVATEGDVVYYCPLPNRLTAADSGHKVYFNNAWVNESPATNTAITNRYSLTLDNKIAGSLMFYKNSTFAQTVVNNMADWFAAKNVYTTADGEYVFQPEESFGKKESGSENQYFSTELSAVILPEFDSFKISTETITDCVYFFIEPRFYRYTNGKWVEILTPEVDTSDIWTAIDEIRGGIDEIEAVIDESGVLS